MSFVLPAIGTFGLIVLVLAPFFCNERFFVLWYRRLRERRWNVEVPSYHGKGYDLSSTVGDEIRQQYLKSKVEPYSMKLSPEMILLPNKTNKDEDDNSTDDSTAGSTTSERSLCESTENPLPTKSNREGNDDPNGANDVKDIVTEQVSNDKTTGLIVENDEEDEEQQGRICQLPLAGTSRDSQSNKPTKDTRQVTNCCAICLGSFSTVGTLCWSSNPQCQHIYHQECILDWLEASGKKYMKQKRKEMVQNSDQVELDPYWKMDPAERVISFPMNCPCCRQSFVADTYKEKKRFCAGARAGAQRRQDQSHQSSSIPEGTSDSSPTNRDVDAYATAV